MKNHIIIALCSLLICIIFNVPALGASTIILDGEEISSDVSPVIENDIIMVPIRGIFEAMGATIDWNQETKTAAAVKGDITVILPIGSTSPTINGQGIPIELPIKIFKGRTLAPVRFVSEAFGGTFLRWDNSTETIYIASAEVIEPDDIEKRTVDKFADDITGLNRANWLDKTNIGAELPETERSNYISALIDIVDQYRKIGDKMPIIYFNENYTQTMILYLDAQGHSVKIIIVSQDGSNGREWVFDSIERR